MSNANRKLDLNTLQQMKDILNHVWMDCDGGVGYTPPMVRDELDKVLDMTTEWIKELEDE